MYHQIRRKTALVCAWKWHFPLQLRDDTGGLPRRHAPASGGNQQRSKRVFSQWKIITDPFRNEIQGARIYNGLTGDKIRWRNLLPHKTTGTNTAPLIAIGLWTAVNAERGRFLRRDGAAIERASAQSSDPLSALSFGQPRGFYRLARATITLTWSFDFKLIFQ